MSLLRPTSLVVASRLTRVDRALRLWITPTAVPSAGSGLSVNTGPLSVNGRSIATSRIDWERKLSLREESQEPLEPDVVGFYIREILSRRSRLKSNGSIYFQRHCKGVQEVMVC